MVLRDYQEQAVSSVLKLWHNGHKNVLGSAATRSGKTNIALSTLSRDMKQGDRALFLGHTLHLAEQPSERVEEFEVYNSLKPVGIVQGNQNDVDARLVCGVVDSVVNRIDQIWKYGKITHIVCDEAHRSVTETYLKTIREVQRRNPDVKILGITATVHRADGRGLREVYDHVAFDLSIERLLREGVLVPVVYRSFERNEQGELSPETIYEYWKRYASDRSTMTFSKNVKRAMEVTKTFIDHGVTAAFIHEGTSRREYNNFVANYKEGKIKVLVNCLKLIEGFDAGITSCIILDRAATSHITLAQAIGRGMGKIGNKKDCLALDFYPRENRSLVLDAADMLGDVVEAPEIITVYVDGDDIREESETKVVFDVTEGTGNLMIPGNYQPKHLPSVLVRKVIKHPDRSQFQEQLEIFKRDYLPKILSIDKR